MAKKATNQDGDNTPTTALAVSTNPKLSGAYEDICSKLEALVTIHDSPYKTNKSLQTSDGTINMETETSVEKITLAIGKLVGLEQIYNKGQEVLGEPVKVFKHNGFSVADYVSDAKLAITKAKSKEKYDKLMAAKDSLTQFLTNEDKLALVLANIKNI